MGTKIDGYVIMKGERYERGSIVTVIRDRQRANRAFREHAKNMCRREDAEFKESDIQKQEGYWYFLSGVDVLTLEPFSFEDRE